jgi:polyferredoxin
LYGALLCAAIGLLTWSIVTRVPLEIDVVRDRNQLYRETNDGRIENVYTISILNMDEQAHSFRITTSGMTGVDVLTEQNPVPVDAGAVGKVVVRLSAAPESIPARKTMVTFHVESTTSPALADDEESRFIGPERR